MRGSRNTEGKTPARVSKQKDMANKLAENLFKFNQERKEIQQNIFDEAMTMIKDTDSATIVSSNSWHKGVVGIVASKLIEKHYKPTIVFSENNDVMTGSARSVKDFNIYQVIEILLWKLLKSILINLGIGIIYLIIQILLWNLLKNILINLGIGMLYLKI